MRINRTVKGSGNIADNIFEKYCWKNLLPEVSGVFDGVTDIMSFLVYVYMFAGLIYAFIGIVTYSYDSHNKLNRVFFIMCIDLALWSLMLTLVNAVTDAAAATVFRRTATFFWGTVFCLVLHFFLILVNKSGFLKKPWALFLFYSPALLSIYLNYFYRPVTEKDLIRLPYGWAYLNPKGNGFLYDYFYNIHYVGYILVSMILVCIWGRQSKLRREKKQSGIILTTFVTALITGSMTDIILPFLRIPASPTLAVVFMLIPVAGIWYSIKKYRFMNLNPEKVVADMMKTMMEGMIIIDGDRLIREINAGALEILGYDKKELAGKPVGAVLCEESALEGAGVRGSFEILLKTKEDREVPVLFSVSALSDEWGEPFGSVLVFQDITEIKRIQDKLRKSYEELEVKVMERTRELDLANSELKNEIKARIKVEEEIKKLAYYDYLTGLPNRKYFTDYLNKKIHESLRTATPLSVMFMDLDSFKSVNDSMGHARGDELLKQVADRLTHTLRKSDMIGRIGGDEFLVLVHNTTDGRTSELVAAKLLDSFREPFILDANEVYITASIGIAMCPIDGEDAETLIKNADMAMYRAKEKGKNKYEKCTSTMKINLVEMMKRTNYLYRAIEKNELMLYYQPQVDTDTNRIAGLEALLRWNHPELGLMPPSEFIPIAEKTGLILPIGEWTLKAACRQNKDWQDRGVVEAPVAVNLSFKQFMDFNLVGKVSKILEETGLKPHFLELEITESILMKETDFVTGALERLNKMGVRVSIDDFGMEYSSLNYIKQLPIGRLKIAPGFIRGIAADSRDEAVIEAIITLARNLGIGLVAEGVETQEQAEYLKKSKCSVMQGYYLYEPMPAAAFEELAPKG